MCFIVFVSSILYGGCIMVLSRPSFTEENISKSIFRTERHGVCFVSINKTNSSTPGMRVLSTQLEMLEQNFKWALPNKKKKSDPLSFSALSSRTSMGGDHQP